ncbi:ABC transporter permease [Gorillibacterium massiliense]|uniref:ABC transporter permease n=1 Tax=Gorillibacterium massiliense TaxID=1280390 RepID=UPI0004ACC4C4|nr:ABC transporter permease subunit [Gorillibacterium massiliense]
MGAEKTNNKVNIRLWLGSLIVLVMLIAAIGGSWFAPYAKDYRPGIQYVEGDKGMTLIVPPLPPSLQHPFGTDKTGNDLLSSMLYGAKVTFFSMLLIAAARVVIGGLIGMFAGLKGRKKQKRKKSSIGIINALPVFIIVYFVMIHLNTQIVGIIDPDIRPVSLAILLGAVLTLLGVRGVASVIQERTAELTNKEFFLAAKLLGAGKRRLIFKHIVPSIRENLAVVFLNECILTLSLIGQLGIFYVFVGGTLLYKGDITSVTVPFVGEGNPFPITFEWAGLIGAGRTNLVFHQWIFLFPLLGYVLLILGLHFLQTGFQQSQNSRAPHI